MRFSAILSFLLLLALTACNPGDGSDDIGDDQATGDADDPLANATAAADDEDELVDIDTYGNVDGDLLRRDDEDRTDIPRLTPMQHTGVIVQYAGQTIFVDPHGDYDRYAKYGDPDLIILTNTNAAELDAKLMGEMDLAMTTLVVPGGSNVPAGFKFRERKTLTGGDTLSYHDYEVVALSPYGRKSGGFSGFVLNVGGDRIFFPGAKAEVPALPDGARIEYAFVPINSPEGRSMKEVISYVKAMNPDVIYPYRMRKADGSLVDVRTLDDQLQAAGVGTEVRIRNWYAEAE